MKTTEEIEFFVSMFEDWSLPGKEWTHEAHLVVGTVYVDKYGLEEGLERIRKNIKAFNIAKGGENSDTKGYHETITVLYLNLIAKELNILPASTPLNEKLEEVLSSGLMDTKIMFQYYTREVLFSVGARRDFIVPDLKPF